MMTKLFRVTIQQVVIQQVVACCLLVGFSNIARGYPGADHQGEVYPGLQDIHQIARFQGIDPRDNSVRWQMDEPNLVSWLLAPWDEAKVNEALATYREEYGSIADTALKVASAAAQNFDASGHQMTESELETLYKQLETTSYLQQFDRRARAITVMETDAQFFPGDVFVTNNLANSSNVAANQKSSSTLVARNTPVFVLGQLTLVASGGLELAEDSWLAIWRPEFGLKFVRSRHVALVKTELADELQAGYSDANVPGQLKLTI